MENDLTSSGKNDSVYSVSTMSTLPSSIPNAMYMGSPWEGDYAPWDISSYQFFLDLGYKLGYWDEGDQRAYLQHDDREIDDLTEAAVDHWFHYSDVMNELITKRNVAESKVLLKKLGLYKQQMSKAIEGDYLELFLAALAKPTSDEEA